MSAAIAVGILVAGGVFLVLRPGLIRITFGFVLLGHGVNILMMAAGGLSRRAAPLIGTGDPAAMADPLPQAFVLTAIVITFGITVYLLAMSTLERPGDEPGTEPEAGSRTGDGEPSR